MSHQSDISTDISGRTPAAVNKAVVERFFSEVAHGGHGDLDALDELVAQNYEQHNPNAKQGREGLREFFRYILSLPEDPRITPEGSETVTLVAEGGFAVRQDIRTNGMLTDEFRRERELLREDIR